MHPPPEFRKYLRKCGYDMAVGSWPEHGREHEAPREVIAVWHCLTPEVRQKIRFITRYSSG